MDRKLASKVVARDGPGKRIWPFGHIIALVCNIELLAKGNGVLVNQDVQHHDS